MIYTFGYIICCHINFILKIENVSIYHSPISVKSYQSFSEWMINILLIDGSYTLFLVQICQQMPHKTLNVFKLSSIVHIPQYNLCLDEFLFSFEVYFAFIWYKRKCESSFSICTMSLNTLVSRPEGISAWISLISSKCFLSFYLCGISSHHASWSGRCIS